MDEIIARVTPGASSRRIERRGNVWHVWVTEPPENGRANDRVRRLLADELDVPLSALTLIRGGGSRTKVFKLE